MTTMIERVALAISESDGMYVQPQPWHFDYARAAIAAMREPTGGMAFAVGALTPSEVARVWPQLIDAALEEKP